MTVATITYTPGTNLHNAPTITLPIGQDYSVTREGACLDICLSRHVALDCPLEVTILIRTNGDVVLWETKWHSHRDPNTYWHFAALSGETDRRPTPAQLVTLERMFLKLIELPGGLNQALGGPVAAWAFADQTPTKIAAKHDVPCPAMTGGEP